MNAAATLNWLNLTTPAGLLLARATRCRIQRQGPFWLATGYTPRFPVAGAFTLGSVVIARRPLPAAVWEHEVHHIRQYAWCGAMFVPLYGVAAAWSWLRTGDWWSRNPFERRAGLRAGGYTERPLRRRWTPRPAGTAAGAAGA
jgi:hypothetical protein